MLTIKDGVPSNADRASSPSVQIASEVLARLGGSSEKPKLAGQSSGREFEKACRTFIESTFLRIGHLRPGRWRLLPDGAGPASIEGCEQFAHLLKLDRLAKENPEIRAVLGNDYTITPDILMVRMPEPDEAIEAGQRVLGAGRSMQAPLRAGVNSLPLLHASISCKWTLRSDRAQNARTEALNLIRNRKGRVPHIVVVTAEPMPGRLASIALGTGDLDCIYHFALYELREALHQSGYGDSIELMDAMVEGNRLKDISDLPFDLAI